MKEQRKMQEENVSGKRILDYHIPVTRNQIICSWEKLPKCWYKPIVSKITLHFYHFVGK